MKRTTKQSSQPKPDATEPQPMDPSVIEQDTPEGATITNTYRVCDALEQFVNEFRALFPETPVTYTNVNGRNTALGARFDLTALTDEQERINATMLLSVLGSAHVDDKPRIARSGVDSDGSNATVVMHNDPRTQDLTDSFGLSSAYVVLLGDDPLDATAENDPLVSDSLIWDGGDSSMDSGATVDGNAP